MSSSHGKEGSGACIVEYELHVFGLAAVIIGIVYGGRDTEASIRSILYERWTGMGVSQGVVDSVLVGAMYHDRR